MQLRILSDLHFEFHRDGGAGFVAELTARPDEVLVLAGDIAVGHGLVPVLGAVCAKWRHVVYVPGNHEYYHHRPDEVHQVLRDIQKRHGGFHWLDSTFAVIEGQRFIGGTLWFGEAAGEGPGRRFMSDFTAIEDFEPWVYRQHERTVDLLRRELKGGDIVVTHHLPSPACVAPRWAASQLNPFFVHDLGELMRVRSPRIWCHGHTHDAVDVMVGDTRVLANPFGYPGQEEQTGFRPELRVEV